MPGETVEIREGLVLIDGSPLADPYAIGETACADVCEWTVPDNAYFVLGDNRQNSLDSRGGWFVPIDSVAGKELFSY
jgi:signal peptidase I